MNALPASTVSPRAAPQHPPTSPPSADKPPRRIQSLEIGFRLARIVEHADTPLALKDVAAAAGMQRGAAHLYLATLVGLGVLSRDAAGKYLLGPSALQMGMAALRRLRVADVSAERMRRLQEQTGHSVHLSIWSDRGPTIVRKFESPHRTLMGTQVGYLLPLLPSSSGRVYLAMYPSERVQPILDRESPGTVVGDASTRPLIDQVRTRQYAVCSEFYYSGFASVSAPIWSHDGQLSAVLAFVDVTAKLDPGPRSPSVQLLKRSAQEISNLLGSG